MIEQIVELFRSADESAWVEPESGGYVCIDGYFDVAIIESWLAEVKAQAIYDWVRLVQGKDNFTMDNARSFIDTMRIAEEDD